MPNKIKYANKIPIMMAVDNNYAVPLIVAMTSMLENKKPETFYHFYILTSSDFFSKNKKIINSFKRKYKNLKIKFVNMKDRLMDSPRNIAHITNSTYYRLIAGEMLPPDYDKAIYLDADIIVNVDLQELFSTDLKENYLGGVKHPNYYFKAFHSPEHLQAILDTGGMKDFSQYINAGILLLNLKKIREDDLEEKNVELIAKNFPTNDQDVINTACYDKILHLPFKYNVMPKCLYFFNDDRIAEIYDKSEFQYAFQNPAIIHWAHPDKPWNAPNVPYGLDWFKYLELSPLNPHISGAKTEE